MEEKRKKLMKMILDSDEKGVEKIYKKIYGKSSNVTEEDILKACEKSLLSIIDDDKNRILILDEYALFTSRILYFLFKEEK